MAEDWKIRYRNEDYFGCEPNPLNRIKQLNLKYGYGYSESNDGQQLPQHRGVCRRGRGRPRKGDATGVSTSL